MEKKYYDLVSEYDIKYDQMTIEQKFELIKKMTNFQSLEEMKEVVKEIEHLECEANRYLDKATQLCEKYAIGYRFNISPLTQIFNMFKIDSDQQEHKDNPEQMLMIQWASQEFRMHLDLEGREGWQHSAVCWG